MGHINDALYFVAPAYTVTVLAFLALGLIGAWRLTVWSRRARAEDEMDPSRPPMEDHQRTE